MDDGIVRAPAGVSNFSEVQAPPSFDMFCVVIFERRVPRISPVAADRWPLLAGRLPRIVARLHSDTNRQGSETHHHRDQQRCMMPLISSSCY